MEGCSVRSPERITVPHSDTILRLLILAGEKCERVMARLIVSIPVKDAQCDEIWGFIGNKQKRVRDDDDPNFGDALNFVAIERHMKLVLNLALGKRTQASTDIFIEGLRAATSSQRFHVSSDGFMSYVSAIGGKLDDRLDFTQLVKVYRYSPADLSRRKPLRSWGSPTGSAYALCTWSARTSRCECRNVA